LGRGRERGDVPALTARFIPATRWLSGPSVKIVKGTWELAQIQANGGVCLAFQVANVENAPGTCGTPRRRRSSWGVPAAASTTTPARERPPTAVVNDAAALADVSVAAGPRIFQSDVIEIG